MRRQKTMRNSKGKKMKDPKVTLKLEDLIITEMTLWKMVSLRIFGGNIQFRTNVEPKLYLNGEEVEKPSEMEDGE